MEHTASISTEPSRARPVPVWTAPSGPLSAALSFPLQINCPKGPNHCWQGTFCRFPETFPKSKKLACFGVVLGGWQTTLVPRQTLPVPRLHHARTTLPKGATRTISSRFSKVRDRPAFTALPQRTLLSPIIHVHCIWGPVLFFMGSGVWSFQSGRFGW